MFGDSPAHGSFMGKAKSLYRVKLVFFTVYWVSKHHSHCKLSKVNIFRQMIHSFVQPPHQAPRLWESLLSARGRFKQQMKLETKLSFDLIRPEGHVLNQTVRQLSVYIFPSWMRLSLGPLEGKLPSVWAAEDLVAPGRAACSAADMVSLKLTLLAGEYLTWSPDDAVTGYRTQKLLHISLSLT